MEVLKAFGEGVRPPDGAAAATQAHEVLPIPTSLLGGGLVFISRWWSRNYCFTYIPVVFSFSLPGFQLTSENEWPSAASVWSPMLSVLLTRHRTSCDPAGHPRRSG